MDAVVLQQLTQVAGREAETNNSAVSAVFADAVGVLGGGSLHLQRWVSTEEVGRHEARHQTECNADVFVVSF